MVRMQKAGLVAQLIFKALMEMLWCVVGRHELAKPLARVGSAACLERYAEGLPQKLLLMLD